jgi:hypothetical protein
VKGIRPYFHAIGIQAHIELRAEGGDPPIGRGNDEGAVRVLSDFEEGLTLRDSDEAFGGREGDIQRRP